MPRYQTQLRALQNELAQIRIDIEKVKLAKMDAANPAPPDQTIAYEDIRLHPDDVKQGEQDLMAMFEQMQAFEKRQQREWYLQFSEDWP